MPVPAVVALAIGVASVVVLASTVIALVAHVRRLGRAVAQLRDEVDPVLREIRADAERACQRARRARDGMPFLRRRGG